MKRKNISLDILIRWNSTYKLLQNITKYKKVVKLYEIQLSNNNSDVDVDVLNDSDWHIACDAPKPGCPLTTRQPAEYSWMSGNLPDIHENWAKSHLYGELYLNTKLVPNSSQ